MITIYAVSDSIGETAEQVSKAAASQFNDEIKVKRVPYIKTAKDVDEFLNTLDLNNKIIIVSTIVLVDTRDFLTQQCIEKGIHIINVLGPIINVASRMLGKLPDFNPGAVWNMDDLYFKKIEAIEFAIQFDDSKDYRGLKNADVVLVGLSRTSKTPLCMYLANKGIKALNIPLVPEVKIPDELFELDRKKIIGLTINPLQLIEIRKHRLDKFSTNVYSKIQYADDERILEEFEFAENVMKKLNCKVIDITKRAIEDTALLVMNYINWNK